MFPPRRNFTAADLVPGRAYRVIRAFEDYDGVQHSVGERWRFARKDFLPYEDGLTLPGEINGQALRIRLQWRAEAQGHIIDRFSNFSKLPLISGFSYLFRDLLNFVEEV